MTNSLYTIRNYKPTDFNKYVLLKIEAAKMEPNGDYVSLQSIADDLGRPSYAPEQDLFVAELGGSVFGYIDVGPELGMWRVIRSCFIYPEHRKRDLAIKLLGYATRRAKELGVEVAHVHIIQGNVAAKKVLSKLGFRFVRRFLQLTLNITKIRWQDVDQAAILCRHLQCGEEDKLTQIQNRCFAGSWGYNPNTVEEITHFINLSNYCPEDVILVYADDKVIGYCWTKVIYEATKDEKKGQIFMLGVAPDWRNKGVSKGVLWNGLSYLKNKGIKVIELNVDSRNQAAYALYRSAGFKVKGSSLWYEKTIV